MKINKVPASKLTKIITGRVYIDNRTNIPYLCVAASTGMALYFINLESNRFDQSPLSAELEHYSEVEAILTLNL